MTVSLSRSPVPIVEAPAVPAGRRTLRARFATRRSDLHDLSRGRFIVLEQRSDLHTMGKFIKPRKSFFRHLCTNGSTATLIRHLHSPKFPRKTDQWFRLVG